MSGKESSAAKRTSRVRNVVRFLAVGRISIGTLFLIYPRASSERLLVNTDSHEGALTFGRMAAGRDVALGLGTLLSTGGKATGLTGWLTGGIIADAVDFYAFVKDDSFRLMPRVLSGSVALSAVAIGAWALKNVDALKRTPSDPSGTGDDD
jgi:hypothetical protein